MFLCFGFVVAPVALKRRLISSTSALAAALAGPTWEHPAVIDAGNRSAGVVGGLQMRGPPVVIADQQVGEGATHINADLIAHFVRVLR